MAGELHVPFTSDSFRLADSVVYQDYPRAGCEARTRVVRGGSWNNTNPDNFRASYRNNNTPTNRNNNLGFRCVRRSPGPPIPMTIGIRRNSVHHGARKCAKGSPCASRPGPRATGGEYTKARRRLVGARSTAVAGQIFNNLS